MASIRKRGNKWQAQVRKLGAEPVTRSFTLRADALAWARRAEIEFEQKAYGNGSASLRRTVLRDLLFRYKSEVSPLKRGSEVEAIRLEALCRSALAEKRLIDLSSSDLAAFRDQRLQRVSGCTVRREFVLLHHVLQVARNEWGYPIATEPLKSIKLPKPNPPRERRLAPGEYEQLMQGLDSGRHALLKPLVILAVETAMRLGEMLGLGWRDIDWDRRTARLRQTKNGHPRTIPLSSRALEALRSLPRDAAKPFPLTPSAVKQAWRRLTKRQGIDNLHLHDLRHEAVSRLFEKGLTVPEVASVSGHRDIRMLARYAHADVIILSSKIVQSELK